MKITEEEAEAFRARVRAQRQEMAKWVVIPIDEVIDMLEEMLEGRSDEGSPGAGASSDRTAS